MTLLENCLIISILLLCLKIYLKLRVTWCKVNDRLDGKTALITGANTGIGFEIALDLARRGARVILACRDMEKAERAAAKIRRQTMNDNVITKKIDLLSFSCVRQFASEICASEERLDILINNAGALSPPAERTVDGHFQMIQTNYLSVFLLTHLLIDLLKRTESRIINISSASAENANLKLSKFSKYKSDNTEYCNSKLCLILFTRELAQKLQNTNVKVYSLHPGYSNTEIYRNLSFFLKTIYHLVFKPFFKSREEGAQTAIYLAVAKNISKLSGEHFDNCQPVDPYENVCVYGLREKLWKLSESLVGLTKVETI